LDDLERDAMTELVNIGVSRAAAGLRKMVGREVMLSVPSLEVISRATAAVLMRERETDSLVGVRQEFTGAFYGQALLIFPEANSLELVRAVTGGLLSGDEAAGMEDEALAETGNVVLTSCLATLANMLERPLDMSIPHVMRGEATRLFEVGPSFSADAVVLFLYINFAIDDRNIRGYIAMLLDLPSLKALRALIREFIDRIVGEGARRHDRADSARP
jgi:chemotaxis protein CheC